MGLRGTKRTERQRKLDRLRVADLYLDDKEQSEIAGMLGLTQQQISYDLKKIKEQ